MPRNHSKKYSVPNQNHDHSPAATTNNVVNVVSSTASAPGVSHFTQSDDEGNVIVELEFKPQNDDVLVHEIPEETEIDTPTVASIGIAPLLSPDSGSNSEPVSITVVETESATAVSVTEPAVTVTTVPALTEPSIPSVPPVPSVPSVTATAEDVTVAPNQKPGFFRSVCRCFKNMCSLLCFSSCCCCCHRKRRGSVQIPTETINQTNIK
jgi:hypothetical protein